MFKKFFKKRSFDQFSLKQKKPYKKGTFEKFLKNIIFLKVFLYKTKFFTNILKKTKIKKNPLKKKF